MDFTVIAFSASSSQIMRCVALMAPKICDCSYRSCGSFMSSFVSIALPSCAQVNQTGVVRGYLTSLSTDLRWHSVCRIISAHDTMAIMLGFCVCAHKSTAAPRISQHGGTGRVLNSSRAGNQAQR